MIKIIFPTIVVLLKAAATHSSDPRLTKQQGSPDLTMQPASKFPTIDMGETNTTLFSEKLKNASREVGFFYLVGHGIPQDVLDGVLETSQAFFALTEAQKVAASQTMKQRREAFIPFGKENLHGVRNNNLQDENNTIMKAVEPDTKETFGIAKQLDEIESHDSKDIPSVWPSIKGNMIDYLDRVGRAGTEFSRLVATHVLGMTGVTELLDPEPSTFLRFNHYANVQSIPGKRLACGDHTDFTFLTFLLTDHHDGLQVFVDEEWQDVPPKPGALIVNFGDMVERLSNGVLPSTRHRVLTSGENEVGDDRYSVGFFFGPNINANIEPLGSFVSDEQPSKYPSTIYRDYLSERLRRISM